MLLCYKLVVIKGKTRRTKLDSIVQAGYVGEDVESILQKLLVVCLAGY